MDKAVFKTFHPGTIFNPILGNFRVSNDIKAVSIRFPSRLNAMAIDPSKIATGENMIFTPGEIVFPIKIYKNVHIKKTSKKGLIEISSYTKRKALVIHAIKIMQEALGVEEGIFVSVDNQNELKHSGLGSSSALIASVSAAMNELYGNPIPRDLLLQYIAQNHGEEVEDSDGTLQQVQCIGGSAASGLYDGGLIILAGKSRVIASTKISKTFKVVIGIPQNYSPLDSKTLMKLEAQNFSKFIKTGKKYGGQIAYRILHEIIPAMKDGSIKEVGDLIFDYRFKMGSINNCSFAFPKMKQIAKKLSKLKNDGNVAVLSLSSVGPAFFAITKDPSKTLDLFHKSGLNCYVTDIENARYKVTGKEVNA